MLRLLLAHLEVYRCLPQIEEPESASGERAEVLGAADWVQVKLHQLPRVVVRVHSPPSPSSHWRPSPSVLSHLFVDCMRSRMGIVYRVPTFTLRQYRVKFLFVSSLRFPYFGRRRYFYLGLCEALIHVGFTIGRIKLSTFVQRDKHSAILHCQSISALDSLCQGGQNSEKQYRIGPLFLILIRLVRRDTLDDPC